MKKIISILMALVIVCLSVGSLAGCSGDEKGEVNVYFWAEYMALGQDGLKNVVDEFEKETGIKVNLTTYDTNEELYNMLKQSNVSYDVICPSDYMVAKLVKENMLQPINFDNVQQIQRLLLMGCDRDGI